MNESNRLARELEKALEGDAWHGPAWREVLKGVTREAALQRPIPGAHTIAEIVLHATTWHEVVRRRLLGETPDVADSEDWPAVDLPTGDAWAATVGRLLETGQALRETIDRFPPERLHESRPRLNDTWYELVSGELQHTLYHLGQVGLLRKAAARAST